MQPVDPGAALRGVPGPVAPRTSIGTRSHQVKIAIVPCIRPTFEAAPRSSSAPSARSRARWPPRIPRAGRGHLRPVIAEVVAMPKLQVTCSSRPVERG